VVVAPQVEVLSVPQQVVVLEVVAHLQLGFLQERQVLQAKVMLAVIAPEREQLSLQVVAAERAPLVSAHQLLRLRVAMEALVILTQQEQVLPDWQLRMLEVVEEQL
jgi:hypothetical protein